jgi:hypothetical protein
MVFLYLKMNFSLNCLLTLNKLKDQYIKKEFCTILQQLFDIKIIIFLRRQLGIQISA